MSELGKALVGFELLIAVIGAVHTVMCEWKLG